MNPDPKTKSSEEENNRSPEQPTSDASSSQAAVGVVTSKVNDGLILARIRANPSQIGGSAAAGFMAEKMLGVLKRKKDEKSSETQGNIEGENKSGNDVSGN